MDIKKIGAGLILLIAIILFANIKVSKILGSNEVFTLIEFIGPISMVFLGPIAGIAAVIFGKGFSMGALSFGIFDVGRIISMPVAALYFAYYRDKKWISIIPILAIVAFILGPNGSGTVWYYSIFWFIPAIVAYMNTKNLFLRSLGATFSAHAIGSVAFLYAFAPDPVIWNTLIPIVIVERVLFALGISGSYMVVAALLKSLFPKKNISITGAKDSSPLLG